MAKINLNKIDISKINTGLNKDDLKNRIKESDSRDDLNIIIEDIKESDNLNQNDKKELLDFSLNEYIKRFSIISEDYKTLKQEAKLFNGMTQINFIFLAMRLKKIRDNDLYKQDNYKDFKEFYQSEIKLSKGTVYYYIDIVDYFIESNRFDFSNNIEYSKLIPFLPLLKNNDITINEKQEIKDKAIELLESDLNKRDIISIAKEYKSKYGLIKESELNIDKLVNGIIKKIPSENRKEIIQEIIDKLNDLL